MADESPHLPAAGSGWRSLALQEFGCHWRSKAKFLAASWLRPRALEPILRARPGSSLGKYAAQRPGIHAFLVWPYQCARWDTTERVRRIVQHFGVVDRIGAPFPFDVDEKLLLWDLERYSADVRVILDQPAWLVREGFLALNVFVGKHRAYSLTFSFCEEAGRTCISIGGMQGRSTAGAQATYKLLTKDFHGMRPRDLLVDAVRILAPLVNAQRILAVADGHRHRLHPFFGSQEEAAHANYDDIWQDRGGTRVSATHFELPIEACVRAAAEVPTRKRAQYRRRADMLESLRAECRALPQGRLVRFEAT